MSSGFDIPEEMIDRFENGEPGVDPGEFKEGEAQKIRDSIENLTDVIKIGINGFDSVCKDRGLPGTGTIDNDNYARLVTIVAKRNIKPGWLKKSPEYLLIGATLGVLGQNYLALQQSKKEETQEGEEDG